MDFMELRTVDPESGLTELSPLLEMIGDARVIGLGECSHGSHEIQRLKHRIVELLAESELISAVVLEANVADVIRVNEYVLEGRGEPGQLLKRHLYHDVCTEEMADLLRWLWAYNAPGRPRLALAGCDMQRIDMAAEIVEDHLGSVDLELAASVADRYDRILEADRARWLSGMGVQAWFPAEEARGRKLRFSGYIRTEDVSDHACIWGWAGGGKGKFVHDSLEGHRPRGTTGWRGYRIELDVPEDAAHVSFGCFLAGNGTAWFDGLSIDIDGERWRNPESVDLDLETDDLRGFWVDPRNRAALDRAVTRNGRPTLRVEPADEFPHSDMSEVEAQVLARQVLAELTERLSQKHSGRALRCARAIVQALEMRTGGGDAARARSMAENIEWLMARDPDRRVVVWGDNAHISRTGEKTGAFLARSLGSSYVSIGCAIGEGSCLAMAPRWRDGLREHDLAVPPPGSFERHMLDTGHPRLIADLRTLDPDDPEWSWLADNRPFRSVGASDRSSEFFDQRIADEFDVLAWVEQSTAAQPLPQTD